MVDSTNANAASATVAYDARVVTWGGVGTYALDLLRALTQHSIATGLGFLGLRRSADTFLEDLPEIRDVHWLVADGDPWTPQGALAAGLAARRAGADLYHATHVTIPVGFDGPLVTTVHDLIPLLTPESMPSRARREVFRQTVGQAMRRSAVIVTDTRSTAETLYAQGYHPRDLRVVHLGVDPRFCPQAEDAIEAARRTLCLPHDYVLWLGGFKPHKNVPTLVRAWASLPEDVREAHPLVLAGDVDTPYGAEVRAEAERATQKGDARSPVVFPGRVESVDLPRLYSGAAAFVFPSLIEGFGLPPLEAAACGTPVLASSAAPLPELLADGAAYFDPRDTEDLARRLAEVLESPDLRASLGARGRARAHGYTWERTATATLGAYRAALSGRTRSAYEEEW